MSGVGDFCESCGRAVGHYAACPEEPLHARIAELEARVGRLTRERDALREERREAGSEIDRLRLALVRESEESGRTRIAALEAELARVESLADTALSLAREAVTALEAECDDLWKDIAVKRKALAMTGEVHR